MNHIPKNYCEFTMFKSTMKTKAFIMGAKNFIFEFLFSEISNSAVL